MKNVEKKQQLALDTINAPLPCPKKEIIIITNEQTYRK